MRQEMGIQTSNNRLDRPYADLISRLGALEKADQGRFGDVGSDGAFPVPNFYGFSGTQGFGVPIRLQVVGGGGFDPVTNPDGWAVGSTVDMEWSAVAQDSDANDEEVAHFAGHVIMVTPPQTSGNRQFSVNSTGFKLEIDKTGGQPQYTTTVYNAQKQDTNSISFNNAGAINITVSVISSVMIVRISNSTGIGGTYAVNYTTTSTLPLEVP